MKIFNKIKNDKGASNSVSFIVIIFFVMLIMVSFIDVGVYFNVKNEVQSAAENGARHVALYGGVNSRLASLKSSVSPIAVVKDSINDKFQNGRSKSVEVLKIECGPDLNTVSQVEAGQKVWCTVEYKYNGLVGNRGLFGLAESKVVVEGSSVSEVFSN